MSGTESNSTLRLVEFKQVMRLLRVTEKEMHRRIARGELPRFMVFDGVRYFNADALPGYLRDKNK